MRVYLIGLLAILHCIKSYSQVPGECTPLVSDFPVSYFFRTPQNLMNKGYDMWEREFKRTSGIISKAVNEEIYDQKMLVARQFMQAFKAQNAEQLVMLHLNGRSRDPLDNRGQYFSGHWLYLPGCHLEKTIGAHDTILNVSDTKVFRLNIQKKGKPGYHDQICIVPVDNTGQKQWAEAEHVKLKSINHAKGFIVVERAQFGSTGRKYDTGSTYLAPHAAKGPFGKHMLWEYNMSTECPRDESGQQAADVFVEEICMWMAQALNRFDGIAFDVTDFEHNGTCQGRHVDVNNDGIGDDGRINQRNVHGEGLFRFFTDLRNSVGDSLIITADGHNPDSQVAIDVLNGMESEGLCTHNDPYRAWSKTVNYISYWQNNTTELPAFNYIAIKNMEKEPAFPQWTNERFAMGTATCLGVPYTESLQACNKQGYSYAVKDETLAGIKQQKQWLGKPVGALQYYFPQKEQASDVILQQLYDDGLLRLKNCSLIFEDQRCIIQKIDMAKKMSVGLMRVKAYGKDILMHVSSRAADSLKEYNKDVPHKIYLSMDEANAYNADRLYGLTDSKQFTQSLYYFRNAELNEVNIYIHFETGHRFELEGINIKHGAVLAYREFEKGVVLVNPSCQKLNVHTAELFPDRQLKHLEGTAWQRKMDPYDINTGQMVNHPLTIHPVDAVFLHKVFP